MSADGSLRANEPQPTGSDTVARIASAQRPLFAYIRSLVAPWGDPDDAIPNGRKHSAGDLSFVGAVMDLAMKDGFRSKT